MTQTGNVTTSVYRQRFGSTFDDDARTEKLFGVERVALRRRSSAKAMVTKANKTGDPKRIREAQARATAADTEYQRVMQVIVAELNAMRRVQEDSTLAARQELEEARRTSDRVLYELRHKHA